jgi:hypothetical protein
MLKFFDADRDPGWKNLDPGLKKFGSGINILMILDNNTDYRYWQPSVYLTCEIHL